MENGEKIVIAAQKYAESQFDAEKINDEELYQNSVEFCARVFKAGVTCAAENPALSYGMAEKSAQKYAKENTDPNDDGIIEDIYTHFMEGVEWYFIEVTKKWTRKPITVNGYVGYQIVENLPWWKRLFS